VSGSYDVTHTYNRTSNLKPETKQHVLLIIWCYTYIQPCIKFKTWNKTKHYSHYMYYCSLQRRH